MRISIDRGGTFTDIYAEYKGHIYTQKLLSHDPQNYDDAPREGIRRLLEEIHQTTIDKENIPTNTIQWIRMGTTVATNALLEHKGAKTALFITKGFGDALEIGYQNREDLFDLNIQKAKLLYEHVFEVDERVIPVSSADEGKKFKVLKGINPTLIFYELKKLRSLGFESIAIVLMHAYSFYEHEQLIAKMARNMGFKRVSVSHEFIPTIKLVERGDTTVVDAYLTPHIDTYIETFKSGFENKLEDSSLSFMQSLGGLCDANTFSGSNAILSGPAGGVVGLSTLYKDKPLIGFDMGGTSSDVSRYDDHFLLSYENRIAGVKLRTPALDILTVASGGGSRLFYRNGLFEVGPESAGAHPGPVCYKKGGMLTITDANLLLGRIVPEYFPAIFGKNEDEILDLDASIEAFKSLAMRINHDRKEPLSIYEIAQGFIDIANDTMSKPIIEVTLAKGHDITRHALVSFGGAGGQHACAIAQNLGIKEVIIPEYAGILSAYGIHHANTVRQFQTVIALPLRHAMTITKEQSTLLCKQHQQKDEFAKVELRLAYDKSESSTLLNMSENLKEEFQIWHQQSFGFLSDREIVVQELLLTLTKKSATSVRPILKTSTELPKITSTTRLYDGGVFKEVNLYLLKTLHADDRITGPAMIIDKNNTIVVQGGSVARIDEYGDIRMQIPTLQKRYPNEPDAISLSIFSNLFSSIANQMGDRLKQTAVSTNIKERLDFSCAIFDKRGELIANAPHVPVHLGSMSFSVKAMLKQFKNKIEEHDVFITNHPISGGSHLPDITIITPHFDAGEIVYIVANRAHHADIGGKVPGSMPSFSQSISEEGAIFKMTKCVSRNFFEQEALALVFKEAGARKIDENISDIKAQIAANRRGITLLKEASSRYSLSSLLHHMQAIMDVSGEVIRQKLLHIAQERGTYLSGRDEMDDGSGIVLEMTIDKSSGETLFDFSKTDPESIGNQNTPPSITASAIVYALRTLIDEPLPLNGGFMKYITIKHARGTLLNPRDDAAVVGGNVTTSQRIVDVIFSAFGNVAASCGCMNNVSFGNEHFGYYETIAGGAGAGVKNGHYFEGASAVHTHMTNTRITDPEILESRYPVILREFSIRQNSGGDGDVKGGNGVVREIEFLEEVEMSILSERRVLAPWGINGGGDGARGMNLYTQSTGEYINLGGKVQMRVGVGESVRIETPGGGGLLRKK
jgi:5-oxoprolinase (ATP-hydrolysing)